jgi:hypothetical protein
LLQNPPVWSDEAIQFLNYKHISVDEAIVSLQNPSVFSDEVIMPLQKFVKRSADTIGRSVSVSEDRTVGISPTFAYWSPGQKFKLGSLLGNLDSLNDRDI